MSMMRVGIGLALIGVAVVFLLFSVIPAVIDSQFVLDILERVYCNAGDQLSAVRTSGPTHDGGTGYSAIYTCTHSNETQYDVTTRSWIITGVGFTVPLLLGIGVLIFSRTDYGHAQEINTNQPIGSGRQAFRVGSVTISTPAPQRYAFDDLSPSLSERLQDLEDAYAMNLVTREEYERKRADIMRRF
jgi:hypothetical protein